MWVQASRGGEPQHAQVCRGSPLRTSILSDCYRRRMTRILHSLRLLGLEPEAWALWECLTTLPIDRPKTLGRQKTAYQYWADVMRLQLP